MSVEGRGRRAVALGVLLAGAAGAGAWLYAGGSRRAPADDFRARLEPLIAERRTLDAYRLLREANAADPAGAALRIARFEGLVGAEQYSLVHDAARFAAIPSTPVAAPAAPDPTPPSTPEGRPDIVLVGDAPVFEDAAAVLGKLSVAAGTPADLEPWQSLVVAPGAAADLPEPTRTTLFLGPHERAERHLGLAPAGAVTLAGCALVGLPGAAALARLGVRVPFDGELTLYGPTAAARPVAEVRCPDGRVAPAVFRSTAGGAAVTAFAFDLPRLAVGLRQGDPRLAGRETDGAKGLRPSDFFPRAFTAGELAAPFADVLLLAALEMAEGEGPALRFWHHPPGTTATLVVTSDQDGAEEPMMRVMLGALLEAGVAPTVFLTAGAYAGRVLAPIDPKPEFVARTRALGVDYSAHTAYWDDLPDLWPISLRDQSAELKKAYGFDARSARFHRLAWRGWMEPVREMRALGFAYDLNFVTLLSKRVPGPGYMTGSALPMSLYDEDGRSLGVRELATQLDDHMHGGFPLDDPGIPQLDRATLYEATRELLMTSAATHHGAIVVNNHPFQFYGDPDWLLGMIRVAREAGMGVLNVATYDAWLAGLFGSGWRATGEGRFTLVVRHPAQEVVVRNARGALLLDGEPVEPRRAERFGETVGIVTVGRGTHTLEVRP